MSTYSVNEIIELAVQIERNGYAFYHSALKRKDLDKQALEFITLLRDQELNHEKAFLSLRDDTDLKVLEMSPEWELVADYLRTIVDARIFNNEDAAIRLATGARDILDIIAYAISFEKDTLLFFHAINDAMHSDKTKMVIRKIINEEVTHILRLTEFRSKLK